MLLDNTDYKLILEALYQIAIIDDLNIVDNDLLALDDDQLESRLLSLRQKISRLQKQAANRNN